MPLAHEILLLHEAGPDRQALASYLERQGLTTTVCDDARQAVAHLEQRRPPRPTLILAHQKRVAAAPQGALEVLRAHPSVLIVPAGSEPIAGYPECVREPFFLDQLVSVIRRTVERGAAGTASEATATEPVGPAGADLLRGIAHAMNNPLTAALGWIKLLENDLEARDRKRVLALQARLELERLGHLSQALAFLAVPPPGGSAFDLAPVVADRVSSATTVGARVVYRPVPARAFRVAGNPAELDLMLRLLLASAHESQSLDAVEIRLSASGGAVHLAISDPRATVPDQDAMQDLGRLLRVERHARALAMALAHSIARRGRGTLRCEPLQPRGAVVTLALPEAAQEREAAQGAR